MGLEEGRIHKLGQHIRRDILKPGQNEGSASSANSTTTSSLSTPTNGASTSATPNSKTDEHPSHTAAHGIEDPDLTVERLHAKLESLQGAELRDCLREIGYDAVLKKLGNNVEELRRLRAAAEMGGLGAEEERDWAMFRAAQEQAQRNAKGHPDHAVQD